ncbi:MAG: protease family protein [Acidimicrobiaceae bacterium]|jgi:membrane protease YdiL (CAAX protease family)
MITAAGAPTTVLVQLRRHLRALLIVFPLLYLLHSFLPDSRRLFVDEDHSAFIPFWLVIAALHWTSVAIGWRMLRRSGLGPADIGLRVNKRQGALVALAVAGFGLMIVLLRTQVSALPWFGGHAPAFGVGSPASTGDRLFWIPIAMTAGICEEFVYRGLAIGGQRAANVTTPVALAWSTIAFVFVHGFSAFFLFPLYIAVGTVMAFIYMRTNNLAIGMIAHCTLDLLAMLAS